MIDPRRLAEIVDGPHPAAIVTVVAATGSTPRKPGATMVVIADGTEHGHIEGTIGGGAVEHRLRSAALEVIATTRPRSVEVALSKELGMCCGGTMTFFIEALRLRPPLLLFGAGHVAQALCRVATTTGFDVTVADPREELLDTVHFPDAAALVDDYQREELARMPFGPDAFVVVATHDHQVDQSIIERVLPLPSRWCALVGSRRKAMLTRERCLNRGVDRTLVEKLRCPAGLDIGAETPEEIAVAIVAEMVHVRRLAEADGRASRAVEGARARMAARAVGDPS
jgi:xanthine dehydrogenase accessory factor